jgi:hypothetical protein
MITILTLFLATVGHLIFDLHKQKTTGINHFLSAAIAILVSIGAGIGNQVFTGVHWYQFAILSLCIHAATFDFIWNLIHFKPAFYHGDPSNPKRAWMDRLWSMTPPIAEVFFKAWFIGVGIGVYFHWDLIVNN